MKITLKNDWDIPINSPIEEQQQGYFVGREKELLLLKNEILRINSGAILVSGYRGVGKTSLIYKTLWEVKSVDNNNIIVLLNASQLEAELDTPGQKIRPRAIIENLIRRLYAATKEKSDLDSKVKTKIDRLYRKTVATEFKLKEIHQQKAKDSLEIEKEDIKEIWASEKNIRNVIFFGSWLVASIFLFGNIIPNTAINNVLALLLAFPIPFFINIAIKQKRIEKHRKDISKNTIELYEFDDTIGNLEFDLEDIHRDIKKDKKKLIYIIDELDKLDIEQVSKVLKFFKNLFTISNAIFVFIGDENIFKMGLESNNQIYRDSAYTYFTSRYFLSRPLWNDLRKFFDEIIEQKDVNDENLEIIQRSIAFDAKNDFFDLKKFIKDKITSFNSNGGNPIIEINEINSDDVQKSRFQKSVTALFEYKYISPSMWDQNETILKILFDHAHKIYKSYSGAIFDDPKENKIENEAIRDFNNFLLRNKAFKFQSENQQTIRGIPIPIRNYSYIGSIPSNPPDDFNVIIESEMRFKNVFEDYISYILALNNVLKNIQGEKEISDDKFWEEPAKYLQQINNWGFDALSLFNANHTTYKNIVKKDFSSHKREEIEQKIVQISNHIKSMKNFLPSIISRILISLNQNKNLQNQMLQNNASLFSGSANEIRRVLVQHNPIVVFNSDLSRQILLIFNQSETLLSIKKHIQDNDGTHQIGCVVENPISEEVSGLHFINAESAEDLKRSLIAFIQKINIFLGE